MFVKETKVKRSGREYSYLQLVEGYRDEKGKVRHRVVANLGRKDALKDSGQLEALAGSFARLDPTGRSSCSPVEASWSAGQAAQTSSVPTAPTS